MVYNGGCNGAAHFRVLDQRMQPKYFTDVRRSVTAHWVLKGSLSRLSDTPTRLYNLRSLDSRIQEDHSKYQCTLETSDFDWPFIFNATVRMDGFGCCWLESVRMRWLN